VTFPVVTVAEHQRIQAEDTDTARQTTEIAIALTEWRRREAKL